MNGYFFPFLEIPNAISSISGLNDAQFDALREAVAGPQGYKRGLERCRDLAARLDPRWDAHQAFELLAALRFFYDRSREWEEHHRDTGSALREFLEITGLSKKLGSDPERGYGRLMQLVAKNPALERRRKLRWLRTGILETAVDFASFVDIRPRYTVDRGAIEELVPVVILRVGTESEYGRDQSHVFQLPANAVAKLRALVEDVEKKLLTID